MGIVALATASCNIDSLDHNSANKGLSFNVVLENEVGTKSGNLELRSDNGDIPLVLQKVVDTKSVQINNERAFVSEYNGSFEVEGNINRTKVFHANAVYNSTTGLWDLQDSDYKWKPFSTIEVVATASNFDNSEFFDGIYYGGSPSSSNFDYTLPEQQNQKDLLVGYFKGDVGTDGCVSLKFNHPLTSIQFKVGALPEGSTLTVNSISLIGLDESAHCVASFGPTTTYQWSNYTGSIDYSKTFPNAQPSTPGTSLIDGNATFIVIPRKFPHNSEAKIVVNVTEFNRTYDVYASLADQEWKPGETNVYAISYQGSRQAVLTNGPDLNLAMKELAGSAAEIYHIVFETGSSVSTGLEVQEPLQWPIYMNWDADTHTITISTSDISIHTGSNAAHLFQGLTALQDITGLTLLNTRKAVDMSWMFESCYALQSVDLSNFNTDNVTNMSEMFSRLKTMTTLDLSSFNTEKVLGVGGMFRGIGSGNNMSSLTSITFGQNFSLRNNLSFAYTFSYTKFTELDLSFFACERLQDIESMFNGCANLQSVNLQNLGVNSSLMFAQDFLSGATNISSINFGPNITFSGLTSTASRERFFPALTGQAHCTIICNQTAETNMRRFASFDANRFSFERPE